MCERRDVRITRLCELPGVPIGTDQLDVLNVDAEGCEHVRAPLVLVVGERLTGPLARDEHAPAPVAQVLTPMRLSPAVTRLQTRPRVHRLDAVAQPVRTSRRTGLVAQCLT